MTKPIKLPPLSGRLTFLSPPYRCCIDEYARLAVEQATAELRAEVERLREVAGKALAYMESVGRMDMYPDEYAIVEALRAALKETK
jgi:predicted glycoside hydrolase/deacetylase ChbG (UPF0249 family)